MMGVLNADNGQLSNPQNSSVPLPNMPGFNTLQTAEYITNLFFSYNNSEPYNVDPHLQGGYNSNSGTSGLLQAAGYSITSVNTPVPKSSLEGWGGPIDACSFSVPLPNLNDAPPFVPVLGGGTPVLTPGSFMGPNSIPLGGSAWYNPGSSYGLP